MNPSMIFWLLSIYAAGTHQLVRVMPHHYDSQAACQNGALVATQPGKTYALCAEQRPLGPVRSLSAKPPGN